MGCTGGRTNLNPHPTAAPVAALAQRIAKNEGLSPVRPIFRFSVRLSSVNSTKAATPALPVAASVITTTLGALATLLVLYRILNQPGPNDFIEVKLGAFLGFLAVLAIAVGGFLLDARRGGRGRADADRCAPDAGARGPDRPGPATRGRSARVAPRILESARC